MNREELWKGDEIPGSPSPDLSVPEIFSTKKIFLLNSHDECSRSDILHIETDYYPQDGSSRHLFHPSGEICDCDCVADGFFGCLRRNKRCLCKIFVILLSSLMIAMLLFPVLSPDVIQTKSVGKSFESVLKTNWNSHYHNYSLLQEDRTIKSDSKNLKNVEVETDLDVSAYEVRDNYGQGRQDQSIEFDFDQTLQHVDPFYIGPVKDSRNSLKKVIVIISDKREPPKQKRSVEFSTNNKEWKNENVKKSYRNIERLQENDWINYSNVNFKGKTVFQSFSLTTPSQWSAFQSNEHSSSLESNEVDEDLIKRTSNNILDAQEFVDKKTDGTSHLKFLSTLKSISDTREKNDEKTNKSFFNEKVVENVTQKPCEKPEVAKSNAWSIGVEEKTNQASARQVLCANWLHQILSPNLDKNKKSEPKKQTALLDVISQDSQTPAEETRDDQIERPSALKEVTRYDMMSSKSKFDESTYRITSMSPLFHEDFTQTSEYSIVEAISLEEALKRKKENMKYKFLNNRVVGGSSDVRYPTGADVSKPSINAFETLKTGQQLSFAPSAASQFVFPYQMCLFPNPDPGSKPSIRSSETRTFSLGTSPLFGSASEKDDTLKHLTRMPSQQNFISFNINNYANSPPRQQIHFPPSGTSTFTFPPYQTLLNNSPFPNTPPIFCTFLQPPLFQFPTLPGTADFSHAKCIDCEESVYQISSNREKLFSTNGMAHCSDDEVSCRDGSGCLPTRNWCDNKVDCPDVSDEAFCSCRDRVARERLCDGYLDCPNGEDEVGCFDCPKSAFSCSSLISPESCIPMDKRCNGVKDCATGNDETDCSALFFHVHQNNSFQVSHTSGFLHRNWKGNWFPVCVDLKSDAWAKEACLEELGYLPAAIEVNFAMVPDYYKGPFIVRDEDGAPFLLDHCKGHLSTYVKCPKVNCGTRAEFYSLKDFENPYKRFIKNISGRNEAQIINSPLDEGQVIIDVKYSENLEKTDDYVNYGSRENGSGYKREETGRVVGGRESEPKAWPWAIAVYKDGSFLCGGVILNERWVLTAAHCMEQYWKHFYEVRGGMLRRFSFSSMEQVRAVADVIVHENYDPIIMNNDLALLRLIKPFHFNRWIRPACLPSYRGGVSNFFSSPVPGTHCIAVGWGALRERGADADQLREVEVPIMKWCKHKEDLVGAEICAGIAEGGKDTCQGDSGGPLMCKNSQIPLAWYVAGIVSHGEGCARPGEPGAYTRISLFLDWITVNANEFKLPSVKPVKICPGFRCSSASKLCIPEKWMCNGFTDCLEAEDEKNCPLNIYYHQSRTQLNSENFTKRLKRTNNSSRGHKMKIFLENKKKKSEREEIFKNAKKDLRYDDKISEKAVYKNHDLKFTENFEASNDLGHESKNMKNSINQIYLSKDEKKDSEITKEIQSKTKRNALFEKDNSGFKTFKREERKRPEKIDKIDLNLERNSEVSISYPDFLSNIDNLTTSSRFQFYSNPSKQIIKFVAVDPTAPCNISLGNHSLKTREYEFNSMINESDSENLDYFQCQKIIQSVLKNYLCDGIRDCEDGSDETNCSCADILKNKDSKLLCDGFEDCADSSDEENCTQCSEQEFRCKRSGECLPLKEKCDGFANCRFGEDEINCFGLVKHADEIELNSEKESFSETRGIVVANEGGTWTLACCENMSLTNENLATKVCLETGWIGYEKYENVTFTANCTGFHVTCSKNRTQILDDYRALKGEHLRPWNVFVYSDGKIMCSAVLLQPEWLLTSSACTRNVEISKNYLVAKLGSKNSTFLGRGEHLIRIDAVRFVSESDIVLMHLSKTINQTEVIRDVGVPSVFDFDSQTDICVTTGNQNVFLKITEHPAKSFLYYNRIFPAPLNCESEPWIGVIVCQSRVGWYPSSAFAESKGYCGFTHSKFTSVQENLKKIHIALEPNCSGFRCPEGFCISLKKVCDGSFDCPSKKDENKEACNLLNQGCKASELRCRNGACISKTFFADGKDDCGDGSDEPLNATCLEYLRLTTPQMICDGKRNCYDKTDEDYAVCNCDDFKFKCHRSQHCIPNDFVCDGEKDCPGGEDEKMCLGGKMVATFKTKAFEIMQKSYGLWHNICPVFVSKKTSDALCRNFGFEKGSATIKKIRSVLVPEIDSFSWVKLNRLTSIALRSDKPLIRLTKVVQNCSIIKCI